MVPKAVYSYVFMDDNLLSSMHTTFFRVGMGAFFAALPLMPFAAHAQITPSLTDDATVSASVVSSQKVSLTYTEPSKLFGIIAVNVPITVSVTPTGSTAVAYPWYSFLFSTDQAALAIRVQAAVNQVLANQDVTVRDVSTANTSAAADGAATSNNSSANASSSSFSAATQTQLTASLQGVLQDQTILDTSANASF
jgi:hypothetical protein